MLIVFIYLWQFYIYFLIGLSILIMLYNYVFKESSLIDLSFKQLKYQYNTLKTKKKNYFIFYMFLCFLTYFWSKYVYIYFITIFLYLAYFLCLFIRSVIFNIDTIPWISYKTHSYHLWSLKDFFIFFFYKSIYLRLYIIFSISLKYLLGKHKSRFSIKELQTFAYNILSLFIFCTPLWLFVFALESTFLFHKWWVDDQWNRKTIFTMLRYGIREYKSMIFNSQGLKQKQLLSFLSQNSLYCKYSKTKGWQFFDSHQKL